MADTLTLDSDLAPLGGLNVESLNVDPNGNATLVLNIPFPEEYGQEFTEFVIDVEEAFQYAATVGVTDSTTGVRYNFNFAEGSAGATLDDLTMIAQFHASSFDFTGYLQGENPCFATGTRLDTPTGPIAVEDLKLGDIVNTLTGPAAVKWIGHRRGRDIDVIRVREGTLGAKRDLIISGDHALHVDGNLVSAGLLADGRCIMRERREVVTFWHVELEQHAILLAEGVQAESYLDTGNRRQFGNCPLAYDPSQVIQDPCAEMVLAGTRLEEMRSRLVRTVHAGPAAAI